MPNRNTISINHNISNIDKIIDVRGTAFNKNNVHDGIILPYFLINASLGISIYVTSTAIQMTSGEDWATNYTQSYVTICYTKSS